MNYHSRTLQYNSVYRSDLMQKATKWADWLDARFVTYDMFNPSVTQLAVENGRDNMPKMRLQPKVELVAREKGMRLQGSKTSYMPRTFISNKKLTEKQYAQKVCFRVLTITECSNPHDRVDKTLCLVQTVSGHFLQVNEGRMSAKGGHLCMPQIATFALPSVLSYRSKTYAYL